MVYDPLMCSLSSPGPELGMEGVGTAMGMPIPLLPLFSLLLLPPLLPLREEEDRRERGHCFIQGNLLMLHSR